MVPLFPDCCPPVLRPGLVPLSHDVISGPPFPWLLVPSPWTGHGTTFPWRNVWYSFPCQLVPQSPVPGLVPPFPRRKVWSPLFPDCWSPVAGLGMVPLSLDLMSCPPFPWLLVPHAVLVPGLIPLSHDVMSGPSWSPYPGTGLVPLSHDVMSGPSWSPYPGTGPVPLSHDVMSGPPFSPNCMSGPPPMPACLTLLPPPPTTCAKHANSWGRGGGRGFRLAAMQTTGARWPNSGPLDPKMAQ
jgi:hypothetical protein